jgi:hypothetical protein
MQSPMSYSEFSLHESVWQVPSPPSLRSERYLLPGSDYVEVNGYSQMNLARCCETESGSVSLCFAVKSQNATLPGKGDIDIFSGR